MKLRTLAQSFLIGVIVGLTILVAFGAWLWENYEQQQSELLHLNNLQYSIQKLTTGIDYITLLDNNFRIANEISQSAERLSDQLSVLEGRMASRASFHLRELAHIASGYHEILDSENARRGISDGKYALSQQMRIHLHASNDAMSALLTMQRGQIMRTQQQAMVSLIIATLVFSFLVVLAFVLIHRRIHFPVKKIDEGLSRLAAGDMKARIALSGDDELAELSRSFNSMVRQLAERIKELRCLYKVLELTTNNEAEVTAIVSDIVALLPESMQYPEAAVARIRLPQSTVCSHSWSEPRYCLKAAIQVEGQREGQVEIGYIRDFPEEPDGEGPFMTEERALLDGIALHIGRMLLNRRMADSLSQGERLRAVGELTGGIAHDFNNLLTVILGNAELLQERLLGQSVDNHDLAEMIVEAAERAAELTRRLLAFARKQPLEPKAVDVNRLISGMETLISRVLGDHIEIEFVRGAGVWQADTDPSQLENALLNLAINARDAMPEGGRLTIETANMWLDQDYAELHHEVRAGQYVMLAVTDTGCGIPEDLLMRIFEPFFTTKSPGKGTGLGLSMVYGFIKQSRGHIKVYSELNQGTTIRMYLPRIEKQQNQKEPRVGINLEHRGSEVILLVDDDDKVRKYARLQIASMGFDVIEAADGQQALEIIRHQDDIDLLFTDVVMPGGMSGRQLADEARKLKPDLKVLYTSGYTENAIVHQGRLDTDVRLVSKPYRRSDLVRHIQAMLGKS